MLALKSRETLIELDKKNPVEYKLGTLFPSGSPDGAQEPSTIYLRIQSAPNGVAAEAASDLPPTPPLKQGDIPGIEMAYTVPAGQISVFALQAPWDKEHNSPDDWYVVAPDDAALNGRITFEIAGEYGRGMETVRMVLATLLDDAGKTLATHRFFAPDDHIVSLAPTYPIFEMGKLPDGEITGMAELQANPESIDLNREGLHMVVFGHREGSEVVDSLRLLAWSVPRPDGTDADLWMGHQLKRLNEKKWNPAIPDEDLFRIVAIEGDVRARAGFLFDTRERVLTPQKPAIPPLPTALSRGENVPIAMLKRGEDLLVTKGSTTKFDSVSGGKFEIGPQVEDGLLIFPSDNMWILPLPDSALTLQVDELPGAEFTIAVPARTGSLVIREPSAFQLGADGNLQVLEGAVTVALDGGDEKTLTSGQAFTLPKAPTPDTGTTDAP